MSIFWTPMMCWKKIADNVSAEIQERERPQGPPSREELLYLLRHIRDNREFYILFFHQNLPLNIYEKFFFSEQPPTPPHTVLEARGIQTEVQLEYHRAFFRAGVSAILKKWLERDCAESPEEIYELQFSEYHGMMEK